MDPVSTTLSIAHLLKRAYALHNGCASAAQEIQLATDQIKVMTLVLEGVKSDLMRNPLSWVHQQSAMAITQTEGLKANVRHCERALHRMENLLKKYVRARESHVSFWDKFKWSTEGKKEIAECKADIVMATAMLDSFLHRHNSSSLSRLEVMVERLLMKEQSDVRVFRAAPLIDSTGRPRSISNVVIARLVVRGITQFRKALARCRKSKINARKTKPSPHPGSWLRAVVRVNSGFAPNKERHALMHDYVKYTVSKSTNDRKLPRNPAEPERPVLTSTIFHETFACRAHHLHALFVALSK